MATKPIKPTSPPQALRSDPVNFAARAEGWVAYQANTLPTYIDSIADFVDARADEAIVAAMAGDLPPIAGQGGNFLRVNPGGTDLEFFASGTAGRAALAAETQSAARTAMGAAAASHTQDIDTITGLQAALDARLGIGQTWQNMLSPTVLRVGNTTYQNTTARPIQVNFQGGALGGGRNLQVSTDGTTWASIATSGNNELILQVAIVPVGHYYRVTTAAIGLWMELR